MIVLDTCALIRFFTKDDLTKAVKVRKLIESREELLLVEAVVMELVFTLLKVYGLSKNEVVKVLEFLLSRGNIIVSEEIRRGVKVFEENNLSITDCLIVAYCEGNKLASFDNNLIKLSESSNVF